MNDLFYEIFIEPIKYEVGHNIANILVYWILFLGFVLLAYLIFKKTKIEINFKLFCSVFPFIAAGALLRAMVDNNLYSRNFFTITPGIYGVFALLFIASMLASKFIEKKTGRKAWKVNMSLGILVFLFLLVPKTAFLRFENLKVIAGTFCLFVFICLVIWLTIRRFELKLISSGLSQSAIYFETFDGTATSMLMFFVGGFEKHPIPKAIINWTGTPFSFLFVKILLGISVVWILNKYIKNLAVRNSLLIAIIVISMGPALRNILSYFIAAI